VTSASNPRPPACAAPTDAALLMDYWLGHLEPSDEEPIELHLLECDSCGARLREVVTLAEGLRALARSGSLRVIVSDALIERATEEGRRVRQYTLNPGEPIACTIAADDDFLVGHLVADLAGVSRVDLSLCDPQGREWERMADIPVRADAPAVVLQESASYAKAAPTSSMSARLLAIDSDGTERLVAEYFFNHTRTIPGPPGWELP
jgi:hypothetical protein